MEAAEARHKEVQVRAADLATRIDQLTNQVSQLGAQVQNTANVQQQQFSEKQEERINEFGRAQQERATEYTTTLNQQRIAADQLLKNQGERFETFQTDADERLQQIVVDGMATASEADAHYKEVAARLIAELEAQKKEADDLVGIIAERGVTSNYQKVANEAWRTMVVWQILTVLALGGLLIAAIFEFIPAMQAGWNWGAFAGRLFVTIAVGLLAGYAGAEARENQKVMRENRQREMDLAAVGPYLASLPEEMRQEFRLKLAERTFTPPVGNSGDSSRKEDPLDAEEQGKLVFGLIRLGIAAAMKSLK